MIGSEYPTWRLDRHQSFSLTPPIRYTNQVSISYSSLINDLGGFAARQALKACLAHVKLLPDITRRAYEPRRDLTPLMVAAIIFAVSFSPFGVSDLCSFSCKD